MIYDVLILGSGAAGLTLALSLPQTCKVVVLSKNVITEGSTVYAQGGMSAVLDATDSVDSHVADTLNAGAGLCDEQVVRFTAEHGAQSIEWLLDAGVPFTRDEHDQSRLHLTREGGTVTAGLPMRRMLVVRRLKIPLWNKFANAAISPYWNTILPLI